MSSTRQIAIKESEGVRRTNHAHARFTLLFHYLISKSAHPGPMNLWPKVMLGVKAVVEPDPIIKLVVTADAPGDRFIGISTVMSVVTVQIGKTMPEIQNGRRKQR